MAGSRAAVAGWHVCMICSCCDIYGRIILSATSLVDAFLKACRCALCLVSSPSLPNGGVAVKREASTLMRACWQKTKTIGKHDWDVKTIFLTCSPRAWAHCSHACVYVTRAQARLLEVGES
eukprot:scaffold213921_cov26-Tisochrysis_lutea.AAC.3